MASGLDSLQELVVQLLEELELPELDTLCEYRWLLELIITICKAREDARSTVLTGPDR